MGWMEILLEQNGRDGNLVRADRKDGNLVRAEWEGWKPS